MTLAKSETLEVELALQAILCAECGHVLSYERKEHLGMMAQCVNIGCSLYDILYRPEMPKAILRRVFNDE